MTKLVNTIGQEIFGQGVLLQRQIKVDLISVIAQLDPDWGVAMNVPLGAVSDRAYLQPQIAALGNAVEVVDDLRLIGPAYVVQVVQEEKGVARG